MQNSRRLAVTVVCLGLLFVVALLSSDWHRWPNTQKKQFARAAGRYHSYGRSKAFFERATPGGKAKSR